MNIYRSSVFQMSVYNYNYNLRGRNIRYDKIFLWSHLHALSSLSLSLSLISDKKIKKNRLRYVT